MENLAENIGNDLRVQRGDGPGILFYRLCSQFVQPVETIRMVNRGILVNRAYVSTKDDCINRTCPPISEIPLEDGSIDLVAQITVILQQPSALLIVEDYFPAGMSYIPREATISRQETHDETALLQAAYLDWNAWRFEPPEVYADHIRWKGVNLPAGMYVLTYYLKPFQAGEFNVLPARAHDLYTDLEGSSAGFKFNIIP